MIEAYTLAGDGSDPQRVSLPYPELSTGELLIETTYSEVCGTDVHLKEGKLAGVPYPIIPGHFCVGRVVQMSGHKQDINKKPIKVGDRLAFYDVHNQCNQCCSCTDTNNSTLCDERQVYGVTHSVSEGPLGGWSQYVLIKRDVYCAILPNNLTDKRYITAGCALPTAIHAFEKGNVGLLDNILVQGAGPVGINIAILCRAAGAANIVIVDKSEVRLQFARDLGFDMAYHVEEFVNKCPFSDLQLDIAFEATGSPIAVKQGLTSVKRGGKYVVVGQYTDNGDVKINPHLEINKKHVTVYGVWGVTLGHFRKMIKYLSAQNMYLNASIWDSFPVSEYEISQASVALDDVRHGRVSKAILKIAGAK